MVSFPRTKHDLPAKPPAAAALPPITDKIIELEATDRGSGALEDSDRTGSPDVSPSPPRKVRGSTQAWIGLRALLAVVLVVSDSRKVISQFVLRQAALAKMF